MRKERLHFITLVLFELFLNNAKLLQIRLLTRQNSLTLKTNFHDMNEEFLKILLSRSKGLQLDIATDEYKVPLLHLFVRNYTECSGKYLQIILDHYKVAGIDLNAKHGYNNAIEFVACHDLWDGIEREES